MPDRSQLNLRQQCEKIEGLAWGPILTPGGAYVTSDNDLNRAWNSNLAFAIDRS